MIGINSYFKLMRPRQWIKNFFVFAALLFSKNLFIVDDFIKVMLCFLCFCLISSSVYIINDTIDYKKDRLHPKKKHRPIASGAINPTQAIAFFIAILLITFGLSIWLLNYRFVLILGIYFFNSMLYCFIIKKVVILDVMSIAFGFLLRVVSGTVCISVTASSWLLLCTIFISLFLGFTKRKSELQILTDNATKHRKILDEYSMDFLDSMLNVITSCLVMSYSLYTFFAFKNKVMMITIPFILYGLFRYQYIVYKKSDGSTPEEAILSDIPLLVNVLLWFFVVVYILYMY